MVVIVVLVSAKRKEMKQFVRNLSEIFAINDLEVTSFYMGCHVSRYRGRRGIRIDQQPFPETLAGKHGVDTMSGLLALVDRQLESVLPKKDSP